MKFFQSIVCATAVLICSADFSHANEGINLSIKGLAMNAARINILSEACSIEPRPGLRARVYEALSQVPEMDMAAVVETFVNEQRIESSLMYRKCETNTAEYLETFYKSYDLQLLVLKQRIEKLIGN